MSHPPIELAFVLIAGLSGRRGSSAGRPRRRRSNGPSLRTCGCVIALAMVLSACTTTPRPAPVSDPVPSLAVWQAVDQEIVLHAQDAQYAAQTYARDAMEGWMGQVRTRTEQDFIPWYTSFFTQQWLAVKVGWYEAGESAGSPDAVERLARHLQQEFYERVLEPVAETTDPQRIMQQSVRRYLTYLKSALGSIRARHRVPARAFDRRLRRIPAIAVQAADVGGASLYQLVHTADFEQLPAWRALTERLGPAGDGIAPAVAEDRFYAVSKRSADELVEDLAMRGGGSATALAIGGVPGMLVSVAVTGWQAIEHDQNRAALEAQLRTHLDAVLDGMWSQLMDDRKRGVMAPVNHLTAAIENGIAGSRLATGR